MLLLCAEKLQNPSIVGWFAKTQGQFLFQSDVKSLSNYPPKYGLLANRNTKAEDPTVSPNDDQIWLSTAKGLWFPILTNLTNLSMDKNLENQTFSIEILF